MIRMERTLNRKEVEEKIANSGDYVKMDVLQRALKSNIDFDTKRYCMLKLSEVYQKRQMFLEAAKLINNVAEINTTYEGKYNDFSNAMDLFIRAGDYEMAELSLKKALVSATSKQKEIVKQKMKIGIDMKAKDLISKDKRRNAADAYEKLVELPFLSQDERTDVQRKLMTLYEKLGRIREFNNIKRAIENPSPIKEYKEEKEREEFNAEDLFR
jgi:tetratricopeptide (TPR) repeat protein